MSDCSGDLDPFEVVAASFVARYRAGERPSVEEYALRHPELASQIRELLPAVLLVEKELSLAGPSRIAHVRTPPDPGRTPRQFGDYRIIREIGRGGMGVVYEAEQVSLGRQVALKVLPRHAASDPMSLARFQREARASAGCTTPISCRSSRWARTAKRATTRCSSSRVRAWTPSSTTCGGCAARPARSGPNHRRRPIRTRPRHTRSRRSRNRS